MERSAHDSPAVRRVNGGYVSSPRARRMVTSILEGGATSSSGLPLNTPASLPLPMVAVTAAAAWRELAGFFEFPHQGCDGDTVFMLGALIQSLDFGGNPGMVQYHLCFAPDTARLHFLRVVGTPIGFRCVAGFKIGAAERGLFWSERMGHSSVTNVALMWPYYAVVVVSINGQALCEVIENHVHARHTGLRVMRIARIGTDNPVRVLGDEA